jgi:hypothetical protein
MKFQVGDKVLLLHSNEEGEVVDIINKTMVTVDVGGVQFPVYVDQIDHPYLRRFTEKKTAPPAQKKYVDDVKKEKTSAVKKYNISEGIWFAFVPVFEKDIFDDDVVEYFKVYLVNNTETGYHFSYKAYYEHHVGFDHSNNIHPYQDFYLHDVPFENLNDSPRFDFEFALLQPNKKKAPHFETSFKPKAKQVFTRIEAMLQKQEATISYLLMETYPARVEQEKLDLHKLSGAGFKMYDAGKAKQHLPSARSVVDLHIDKISSNWKGLSNYEILSLQLKEFNKYYELALLHLQPSLIVIHGVGEGVLKYEIHEILRSKKEVKSFVNQFHPLYGYGATEIYFQY